jgi:hypothetical protein
VNSSFPGRIGVVSSGFYLDRFPSAESLFQRRVSEEQLGAELCLWGEWVGDNLLSRAFPAALVGADVFWRPLLSDGVRFGSSVMRARVAVAAASLRVPSRVFASQIASLARGALAEWRYNNSSGGDESGALFEAVHLLCRSVAPSAHRTDQGGPIYPLASLADAAVPDSMLLWALRELADRAVAQQLGGDATQRLRQVLLQYSTLADARMPEHNLQVVAQDLALVSKAALKFIDAVAAGTDTIESDRLSAIRAGTYE